MSSRSRSASSRSCQYSPQSNRSTPSSFRSSSRSRSPSSRRRVMRKPDYRRAAVLNLRNQRIPPFNLQPELSIGSKRQVDVDERSMVFKHHLVIYHKSMSDEERNKTIKTLLEKGHSEHRCATNGNNDEFSQKTYQGEHLIYIESVFKVKRSELHKAWESKDIRRHDRVGIVRIQNSKNSIGDISLTTTYSLKNDHGGFGLSAKMRVGMASKNEDETRLTRKNSDYRRRNETPNVEDMVHLGETFAADQKTMVLSSDTCLTHEAIQVLQMAQEERQYSLDMRNHREMTFLEPSFRSPRRQLFNDQSPNSSAFDMQSSLANYHSLESSQYFSANSSREDNKNAPAQVPQSPSLDGTQYFSADEYLDASEDQKSTPVMVQKSPAPSLGQYQAKQETLNRQSTSAPKSPKPTAHVSPQFTVTLAPRQQATPPPKTPPARVQKSPVVAPLPDSTNNSQLLKTAVQDKSTIIHRHQLKLFCDIGGMAYEFTGNIAFQAAPNVAFDPRRVVCDSKVLWQHSNEWNPTSITSSYANMTGSFVTKK